MKTTSFLSTLALALAVQAAVIPQDAASSIARRQDESLGSILGSIVGSLAGNNGNGALAGAGAGSGSADGNSAGDGSADGNTADGNGSGDFNINLKRTETPEEGLQDTLDAVNGLVGSIGASTIGAITGNDGNGAGAGAGAGSGSADGNSAGDGSADGNTATDNGSGDFDISL